MRRGQVKNDGFSLIEAIISVVIASLVAGAGYIYVGRKIVDDDDPVRAAKMAGYPTTQVLSRKDFSSPFSRCGHDHVTFLLSASKPDASDVLLTVCCPAWYGNCRIVR